MDSESNSEADSYKALHKEKTTIKIRRKKITKRPDVRSKQKISGRNKKSQQKSQEEKDHKD